MTSANGGTKMEEQIHRNVNDNPDSIEIGTPAKGGALKVYGSALTPEDFKKKIDNMMALREYANKKLNGSLI